MKPYPSYKNSGVEWIGIIPSHWDTIRCGFLFKEKSIKNTTDEVNLSVYRDYGVILRDSRDDNHNRVSEDTSNYKLVEIGDFVFNKMKCWMGSLGVSEYRGIVSPSYTVCKTTRDFHRKYIHHLLRSTSYIQEYEKYSYGVRVGQWELHFDDFKNIISLFPSLPEQQYIVSFLDHKIKQVDDLIEKTEKKIELLKEQRTSLINHCVTKGLNPNVEMKDSGVEWIGEIPKHWSKSKLKYDTQTQVRYGLNISGDRYTEEGVVFIRITDIDENGILNKKDMKYLHKSDVEEEYLLSKYDFLLCRSGHTVGKSYLHLEDGKYTSGGYLVRFNFGDYYPSKFVFYVTRTGFYKDWIQLNTIISTIENVNGEKYSNMEYPKPPPPEQQKIVDYIDEQTQKIDSTIEKETQRIELLKEYRQSLISNVVTGKIDVRDWKNDTQKLS